MNRFIRLKISNRRNSNSQLLVNNGRHRQFKLNPRQRNLKRNVFPLAQGNLKFPQRTNSPLHSEVLFLAKRNDLPHQRQRQHQVLANPKNLADSPMTNNTGKQAPDMEITSMVKVDRVDTTHNEITIITTHNSNGRLLRQRIREHPLRKVQLRPTPRHLVRLERRRPLRLPGQRRLLIRPHNPSSHSIQGEYIHIGIRIMQTRCTPNITPDIPITTIKVIRGCIKAKGMEHQDIQANKVVSIVSPTVINNKVATTHSGEITVADTVKQCNNIPANKVHPPRNQQQPRIQLQVKPLKRKDLITLTKLPLVHTV
jgi:hypothetical protein